MATRARGFDFLNPTHCDSGQFNFLSPWDPPLVPVVGNSLTFCHPGILLYQLWLVTYLAGGLGSLTVMMFRRPFWYFLAVGVAWGGPV